MFCGRRKPELCLPSDILVPQLALCGRGVDDIVGNQQFVIHIEAVGPVPLGKAAEEAEEILELAVREP